MGLFFLRSGKSKREEYRNKWDAINLADFRTSSCLSVFSYIWLISLIIISIVAFIADVFTAINLLAYNRFAGEVKPSIPFHISKWIFAATILFSVVLIVWEWLRAIRIIRGGVIVDSYLDSLAGKLQSVRDADGWRRFLVFSRLTESKKGADYVAIFVYFQFQGAIRLCLGKGPRQVINAVTLWSVVQADLLPKQVQKGSPVSLFFQNLQYLANQPNKFQVVMYFSMLYTFVLWVIDVLCLIVALLLYLIFLWHYIPAAIGGLSDYCRYKIDSRVGRIAMERAKKVFEKEEARRRKMERAYPPKPGSLKTVSSFNTTTSGSTNASLNTLCASKSDAYRLPTLPRITEDDRWSSPALPPYHASAFPDGFKEVADAEKYSVSTSSSPESPPFHHIRSRDSLLPSAASMGQSEPVNFHRSGFMTEQADHEMNMPSYYQDSNDAYAAYPQNHYSLVDSAAAAYNRTVRTATIHNHNMPQTSTAAQAREHEELYSLYPPLRSETATRNPNHAGEPYYMKRYLYATDEAGADSPPMLPSEPLIPSTLLSSAPGPDTAEYRYTSYDLDEYYEYNDLYNDADFGHDNFARRSRLSRTSTDHHFGGGRFPSTRNVGNLNRLSHSQRHAVGGRVSVLHKSQTADLLHTSHMSYDLYRSHTPDQGRVGTPQGEHVHVRSSAQNSGFFPPVPLQPTRSVTARTRPQGDETEAGSLQIPSSSSSSPPSQLRYTSGPMRSLPPSSSSSINPSTTLPDRRATTTVSTSARQASLGSQQFPRSAEGVNPPMRRLTAPPGPSDREDLMVMSPPPPLPQIPKDRM